MSGITVSRRQVLASTALAGTAALVAPLGSPAAAHGPDPFLLGVASGDPTPFSVILWTRLLRDRYDAGSMPNRPVEVDWQVARDERFRHVVRHGRARARPELAHSVRVDAVGLRPGREYFYRFRALGRHSPVGRTRTAPAPWDDVRTLRLGIVNCQDLQNGYWPAYRGLVDEDLDVVFHLGDYIYEYDPHANPPFADRVHVPPQTLGRNQLSTLTDYRNRHAQYKSDPALQAAHAAFPWIVTWDDHEVENDYADLVDEHSDAGASRQTPEQLAAQRAAAYQAYYEHMPIRARYRPGSADLRIFRRFDFGRLARFSVLDTRQYRTDQPEAEFINYGRPDYGTGNVDGTLTGAHQERWLAAGLIGSPARWNVIAQQVMMSRVLLELPGTVSPLLINTDQWDGYSPHRDRLLRLLADRRVANPVVLAGDVHSSWFSDLRVNFDRPETPPVAVEWVATSISSYFPTGYEPAVREGNRRHNPHVKYFNGLQHGYLRCVVDRNSWRTDARVVDTIARPDAPVRTDVSFVAENGRSAIIPA